MITMYDSKTTRFTKRIGISEDDYVFINARKSKKSAAGFLEHIIKFYKDANVRLPKMRRK